MRKFSTSSLIWMCLFLTGCGFHLRGVVNLPSWLSNVTIISKDKHSELYLLLKNQLQSYHIQLNDDPHLATYWLVIEDENIEQHIAGVSSSTTPRQYLVVYSVTFKVQTAKGAEMVPTTIIRSSRLVTINSNRMLGSVEEEGLLKSEMRRDAVVQIIHRISQITTINPHPQDAH